MRNKLIFFPTSQFYNAILDLSHDCLLLIDVKTKLIVYANKACNYLYGYTPEQLIGTPISVLIMAEEQAILQKMNKVIQSYPNKYRFEVMHVRKNGQPVHVEVISRLVIINERKYFLSHITNITKQKQMRMQIQKLIRRLSNQAYYDQLTQAYNRTYLFNNYLRRILNRNTGIILVNINKFKTINDTYGHQAGDLILIEVTKCLRLNMQKGDKLIRYSGDEMLLVSSDTPLEKLIETAQQIKTASTNRLFKYQKQDISYTLSFGIAHGFVLHKKDFELLIKEAHGSICDKSS